MDAVLREAGGGRMAGVRTAYEFGRQVFVVQFVRGSWLCAATVDAATGDVLTIQDEGLPVADANIPDGEPAAVTLRPGFSTVWDVCATAESPDTAYVATGAGVAVVRLCRDVEATLVVEDHHVTGFGVTRHVAPVPGGVVASTADGRMFGMDTTGRLRWKTRLPGCPHTVTADAAGARVLAATNAGAVELDAGTGAEQGRFGGSVRAAAYLPNGDRIVADHRGDLIVTAARGRACRRMSYGAFPDRLWVDHDRIYVAGEDGVKEFVAGYGVVARWSAPGAGTVENAVVIDGSVFTCSGGSRLDRHGYATAAHHGRLRVIADPEALTALEVGRRPWLLVGHRDGRLSALPV
ncbi:hypothetical protein GCM10009531_25720 [Actinoplanes capillaceus]